MTSELIKEYGYRLLPHLVQAAKTMKTPTYGELAEKIGVHHRVMNRILGYIRDDICIQRGLPLITCIVVGQATGLPGDDWLPQGTSHLSPEEYRSEFERFRDQVFAYKGWDSLLKELDMTPLEPTLESLDDRGRTYSEYIERVGGGEDEGHRKLKEYVAAHPEAIGLPPENAAQMEYLFVAGDRADIVFGIGPDAWAVVEIKNGEIGELVKGVYQAIKYRAMLQAEKGHGISVQVDAILVAYEIPSDISYFAAKFGIRCRIIRREIMGRGI
ncbi:MAG: hypothetical protein ABSA23_16775 [Anaerolineales bacterium]|jgi:hypothetical protein